jgi:BclA C-terminal domain
MGPAGTNGMEGATGPAGPTGPQGPAGGSSEYGYVYNLDAEVVAIEADVTFSHNGILTPGITHAPGDAGISFTTVGIYKITYSVSGVEPGQFALFINGAEVAGTVYGSGAGTQQNNGQAIVSIASADVLTLRNHSSAAAVTLQTLAGGTQINVNASILIQKLN